MFRPRAATMSFTTLLGLVTVAALVLRVVYVLVERDLSISNDGGYYRFAGQALAEGRGFVHPFAPEPIALHPPGWPIVLSVLSVVGLEGVLANQLLACVVGSVTVLLVGLAGRAVVDDRVGIIAAVIAAIHPNVWLYERTLFSETLVPPLVAGAVLLAHRHWRSPRLVTAVAVGVLCALLALVRSEQLLLVGLLLVPLVLLAGRVSIDRRQRLTWLALGIGAAGMVLAPWVVYNNLRFEEPVLVTTSLGVTLRVSNCNASYGDELLGHIDARCYYAATPEGDESAQDVYLRGRSLAFIRDNASRVPAVVAARHGRTWGVYRPFQQMRLDAGYGRDPLWVHRAGFVVHWVLVPLAVVGAVVVRRRGAPLFVLLSFVVVVLVATTVTYGQTRFRVPAEVTIAILAAAAIDAGVRRARRSTRAPDEDLVGTTAPAPTDAA